MKAFIELDLNIDTKKNLFSILENIFNTSGLIEIIDKFELNFE